jgi:hypothetical protein
MAETRSTNCPVCLDTGIVKRDGTPRVLTGEWCTTRELMRIFKPCPVCRVGEAEQLLWRSILETEAA